MKRTELLKQIAKAAKAASADWVFVREGANHEVWSINGRRVTVPRHAEINEITARSILRTCFYEMGK